MQCLIGINICERRDEVGLGRKRGQSMMELDEASVNPLELWHSSGY